MFFKPYERHETTWNDNDCCLSIVIGPKVWDTTFKEL